MAPELVVIRLIGRAPTLYSNLVVVVVVLVVVPVVALNREALGPAGLASSRARTTRAKRRSGGALPAGACSSTMATRAQSFPAPDKSPSRAPIVSPL